MAHIKNILIECDNDIELAKIAIEIENQMSKPVTRRAFAIAVARFLINSFKKEK